MSKIIELIVKSQMPRRATSEWDRQPYSCKSCCARIDRLEALLIAAPAIQPSLDEVLEEMVARKRIGRAPESEGSAGSTVLKYDIFDSEDGKLVESDAGDTDGTLGKGTDSKASQTLVQARKRNRNARCNGWAVQTQVVEPDNAGIREDFLDLSVSADLQGVQKDSLGSCAAKSVSVGVQVEPFVVSVFGHRDSEQEFKDYLDITKRHLGATH